MRWRKPHRLLELIAFAKRVTASHGTHLTAMLKHWPAIQAAIANGTYKESTWKQRILATARGLRRAKKTG